MTYSVEKVSAEREASRGKSATPQARENVALSKEKVAEIRQINNECRQRQLVQQQNQTQGGRQQ